VTPYLLVLAVLLGIAPGLIAHGKGRRFFPWWLYGVVLGPVALLHAIVLPRYVVPSPFATPARRPRSPWRSHWPAVLWAATSVAIAIVAVTVYGLFTTPHPDMPKSTQDRAQLAERKAPPIAATRTPAAPQAAPAEPPLTVRVTVRREPSQAEKAERAPAARVERMVAGDSPAPERAIERTMPREPAKPAPVAVAARPTPAASPTPDPTPPAPAVAPSPSPQPAPPVAIAKASPATAPETDVTAIGEAVRIVQQALAERGYDPGPVNGRAGHQTHAAIRKFQSAHGLDVTGAIDYALFENLGIVGPREHAFQPPKGMPVGR